MLEPTDEAVAFRARPAPAAKVFGLSARTIIRWRKQQGGEDRRRGPQKPPPHRLSEAERKQTLETANSERPEDLSIGRLERTKEALLRPSSANALDPVLHPAEGRLI